MPATPCTCIGHLVKVVDFVWVIDVPDPECTVHHKVPVD